MTASLAASNFSGHVTYDASPFFTLTNKIVLSSIFNTFCKDHLSRDPERTSLAHCLQGLYKLPCIILNPTEIVRFQTIFKQRTAKGLGITDDWNDGFS